MDIITIGLCCVLFVYGCFSQPRIINPLTVFFGEWMIILIAAKANLYGILTASSDTYAIIFVGSLMYFLGFVLNLYFFKNVRFKVRSSRNLMVSKPEKEYVINNRIVYFFAIISIIFYLFDLSKNIGYLLSGNSLGYIRTLAQQGAQYEGSGVQNAIRILIVSPYASVLMILAASDFFSGKRDKKLLLLTSAVLILKLLSDGSRSRLVYLIISFVVCFLYSTKNGESIPLKGRRFWTLARKLDKKTLNKIKWIIVACVVTFLLLYAVTLSRSGENLVRFAYYYFAMEPIMLEKWCDMADASGVFGYGEAAINGFLFPIFYIIANTIRIIGYPTHWRSVYDFLETVGTNWQTISIYGTKANSYASVFFTLYVDGRMFGVVLGMFLYGMIMAKVYKNTLKNPSGRNLSLYCIFILGVFYTFVQLMFKNMYYCITLLMLAFMVYKKEEKVKVE